MRNFVPRKGRVKGVNGIPATIKGTGTIDLSLECADGRCDIIPIAAVYVPTSPYDVIPPQLLINESRNDNKPAQMVSSNTWMVNQTIGLLVPVIASPW